MSKVFTANEFIKKLKYVASLKTTYYSVSGGAWAKWNGKSWNFDCVILVKAILWGWCENKNHAHGGAKYLSNGVKDDNADGIINRCSNVSTNFTNLTPGELLWMKGHCGIYIGNGEVIECTAAWEKKVLYSKIDSKGRRIRNGIQVGSWKKHGKLNYIDYADEVKKEEVKSANTNTKTTYKVVRGDTLSSIAIKYKTTWQEIYKINKTIIGNNPNMLRIGLVLTIPGGVSEKIHVVKSGETLIKIASIYKTTWQKIYNNNRNVIGSNPNLIKPGMKLVIK